MTSVDRLQLLMDERSIKRCIARYCHATDRLDWAGVVDCYVPGAIDDHGTFTGPVDELADWLKAKSEKRGAKQHYVTNHLIEVAGDHAVAETAFLAYMEFIDDAEFNATDEQLAVAMGGRYVDRLSRHEGEWRIAERTVLMDWTRELGAPLPWAAPAAARFQSGRTDGRDPGPLARAEMVRVRGAHESG